MHVSQNWGNAAHVYGNDNHLTGNAAQSHQGNAAQSHQGNTAQNYQGNAAQSHQGTAAPSYWGSAAQSYPGNAAREHCDCEVFFREWRPKQKENLPASGSPGHTAPHPWPEIFGIQPYCSSPSPEPASPEGDPAIQEVSVAPDIWPGIHTLATEPEWIQAVSHPLSLGDGSPLLDSLGLTTVGLSLSVLAGRTAHFLFNWRKITSYPWVLQTVSGYRIELLRSPQQTHCPVTVVTKDQEPLIEEEVVKLRQKGAIISVTTEDSQRAGFCSTIFLVPKKESGQMRPVVNLKPLNRFLPRIHL